MGKSEGIYTNEPAFASITNHPDALSLLLGKLLGTYSPPSEKDHGSEPRSVSKFEHETLVGCEHLIHFESFWVFGFGPTGPGKKMAKRWNKVTIRRHHKKHLLKRWPNFLAQLPGPSRADKGEFTEDFVLSPVPYGLRVLTREAAEITVENGWWIILIILLLPRMRISQAAIAQNHQTALDLSFSWACPENDMDQDWKFRGHA